MLEKVNLNGHDSSQMEVTLPHNWVQTCILHSPTDPQGLLKDSSTTSPPLLKSPYSVLRYSKDSSRSLSITDQRLFRQSSRSLHGVLRESSRIPQGVFMDSSRSLQGLLRTWQISRAMKSWINLMPWLSHKINDKSKNRTHNLWVDKLHNPKHNGLMFTTWATPSTDTNSSGIIYKLSIHDKYQVGWASWHHLLVASACLYDTIETNVMYPPASHGLMSQYWCAVSWRCW